MAKLTRLATPKLLLVYAYFTIHNTNFVDACDEGDGDNQPTVAGDDRGRNIGASRVLTALLVILTTIAVYYFFRFCSWYGRILRVGREMDKLPGDKKHWLFGNLREVDDENL